MNDRRYRSYVYISRVLRSDFFNALERAVLLDGRGSPAHALARLCEIGELEANVDATLDGLISCRRIHATTAAEWRKRIRECGPQDARLIAA